MRVETTSELLPLKRATRTRADHCGLIRWQELPPFRESIADPPQVLPQPLVDRPSTLEHNAPGAKSFRSREPCPIVRLLGDWTYLVTGVSPMRPHPPRCGDYGFDAPYAPLLMALGGACLLALCLWRLWDGEGLASTRDRIAVFAPGFAGLWLFLNAGIYTYTTRAGKFAVWAELLDRLKLKGDERLLDVGCGRGAVLLMAAQRLPRGRAVGVDLWSTKDQSGNAEEVTRRNAVLEGVTDRVELHTADMRRLPFDDGSFDVVSSVTFHYVSGAGERTRALGEATGCSRGSHAKAP